MNKTKEICILGFAVFSLFFGAGNLILPPFLGLKAGSDWLLVGLGFAVTAVLIPILGIVVHGKLQGTMYDFGKKVSPWFSLIYCFIVYSIALALPAPRTAAVTHEISIAPLFGTSSLITSLVYFLLVFVFVMNRSKLLNIIGKYLTPLIGIILFLVIVKAIFLETSGIDVGSFDSPIISGVLEGYQTFDAIGGVVVGGILVISLNLKNIESYDLKKELIIKGGMLAGVGLLVMYFGLILSGALFSAMADASITRTALLSQLSNATLGNLGASFLGTLVALACFTTAVGIIAGAADYFKGRYQESEKVYLFTVLVGCVLGVVVGQFDVHYIILVALPVLMFIYPITIVLICLNLVPERHASPTVFRWVVLVTIVFSIPDFLQFLLPEGALDLIIKTIPLGQQNLGWLMPALFTFLVLFLKNKFSSLNA